jgi:hypothetical protein
MRAYAGMTVLTLLGIDARLVMGTMVCRVGPDESRDAGMWWSRQLRIYRWRAAKGMFRSV